MISLKELAQLSYPIRIKPKPIMTRSERFPALRVGYLYLRKTGENAAYL